VRLSVVIPTLNEERHLGQLLSDIQRQNRRPDEVIVVDAGSSDATVRIAGRSSTVVLHGQRPVARGRNLGGYSATGDLIFFLDADTRLPQTFFEDFVCGVERRRLDIACPRYLPYDSTPTIRAIHTFWNVVLKASERTLPSGAGHCIAGATGRRKSSARSSCTCSWRPPSPSASSSGPTGRPTSSETTPTRLQRTIRQPADRATLRDCAMKSIPSLRHLQAHRCDLARDVADSIHQSA